MSAKILYLTHTKHGVWYYQRWLSRQFLSEPKIFKVSLRTKDKRKAFRLSRIISVQLDKLAFQHFDNVEDFAQAMKLLYEVVYRNISMEEYEELDLDPKEDWLLTKAERYNQQLKDEFVSLQSEITFLKEAVLNLKNSGEHSFNEDELIKKITESARPSIAEEDNPTLFDYTNEWKEDIASSLTQSTYSSTYLPAIELFNRFIYDMEGQNDVRVSELKPEHIRSYQKFYPKIPKGTVTKKFSISELMQLQGEFKLPKTIIDHYTSIGSFINWGRKRGYHIDGNLSLMLGARTDQKSQKNQSKDPVPLSDVDLRKFFMSENYLTGKFSTSAMYWVPIIALYTGARMSEIVQLEKHNILNVENTWVLDITDDDSHKSVDDGKRLKAAGSKRQVPIHKQILKLGFIDYVNSCSDRLFPDEPRNKVGKFDRFQKRQSRYRKQVGVVPSHPMEKKDFHSFRHTVSTRLRELRTIGNPSDRFDTGLIDAIVGHSSKDRSIGESVYNHSQYIEAKSKALNRLIYPSIDFNRVISWEKCDFNRKPYRQAMQKKLGKL